jgi:3-(3-hydroxy-phenyl)propionate hydroxylase
VLDRGPVGRKGLGSEVTARPLPGSRWRLDWLLPPRSGLVTPEGVVHRVEATLGAWRGAEGPYELLDTGVHTVHHRLARRWRGGRVFLAGDAAHLLGSLGAQQLDEGLADAENLAWKLAEAWHSGASASPALLDSYEAERRGVVSRRLRAADQALPLLRPTAGWRAAFRGGAAATLLTDGHAGRGAIGAAPVYAATPLAPEPLPEGAITVGTAVGARVADIQVTAPDGWSGPLHARLGREPLVVLVAPGTRVWERSRWLGAGLMPKLVQAVEALPVRAVLLIAEDYPQAPAHTVLYVRPDGHLVAALAGVRPDALRACAQAARGGAAEAVLP